MRSPWTRLRAFTMQKLVVVPPLAGAGTYFLMLAYYANGLPRGRPGHPSIFGHYGEPVLAGIGVALLAAAVVILLRRDPS